MFNNWTYKVDTCLFPKCMKKIGTYHQSLKKQRVFPQKMKGIV